MLLHAGVLAAIVYVGTRAQMVPFDTPIQVAFIPLDDPAPPATAPEPNSNPIPDAPPLPEVAAPEPVVPEIPPPPPPEPKPKPKPVAKPKPVPKPTPKPAETAITNTQEETTPAPVETLAAAPSASQTEGGMAAPAGGGAALPGPLSNTAGGGSTDARYNANYLNNPKPRYPPISRRMREEGKVMLRVLVTADGLPGKIELSRSSGFDRLDSAALESVRRWRFVPATRGGRPVEAWVLIPIVFNLEG